MFENMNLDKYDKEIRKTYKPRWHDSARTASRVLDRL